MKAAQPFMLIVVQIGNTKRATAGCAFKLSSADANVTGNVAAEDFVNNATATAGDILRNTSTGFKPRNNKNNGITIKNWIKLPPITTAVYLPKAPTITPASICADN